MKYLKLFSIALAALAITACSDDDEKMNSASGVTVQLSTTEVKVKESKGIFTIPLEVTGEANGLIKVTLEVDAIIINPALENTHYVVTDKTLLIPKGETSVNVEINTIRDDGEQNDPREFVVMIVNVEGATIGANNYATVIMKDADSEFYDKLTGKWYMNFYDAFTDDLDFTSYPVTISGEDLGEDDDPDGAYLYISGLGLGSCDLAMIYHYDNDTKEGYLEIPFGYSMGTYSGYDLEQDGLSQDFYIYDSGSITATWNDDFTEITVDPEWGLFVAAYSGGSYAGGFYGFYPQITFTKTQPQ
ncbi:MAG: hypothetical protein LIO90_00670 [Bacteroidales bacterium]|nr:hypothetical protein [Bacteroidales bacterium]